MNNDVHRQHLAALTAAVVLAAAVPTGCSARARPDVAGPTARHDTTVAGGPAPGLPRYLITAVGGRGYIRSTATGRVISRIRPPARGFAIEGIAVPPGARAFYLAGRVPIQLPHVQLEFFKLTLDRNGRPGPPHRLPGPPVITQMPGSSNGLTVVPLAISPDGKELAYASSDLFLPDYAARHPATITLENVATGRKRTWSVWPAWNTVIRSVSIATGSKLGFVATLGDAAVSSGMVVRRGGSDLNVFMVLNTAAPGTSLTSDSRLLAYGSATVSAENSAHVLPGPTAGILSPDGRTGYALIDAAGGSASLVQISVPAGKVTRVLVRSGAEPYQAEPNDIDGGYLLISLGSRRPQVPRARYVCGHLAGMALASGRITALLPVPLYCSDVAPPPPFLAAW